MISSRRTCLLLSLLFISFLFLSCKTTITPRTGHNKGSYDATGGYHNDDDDIMIVKLFLKEQVLNKIKKSKNVKEIESTYIYSVEPKSMSNLCTTISEQDGTFTTESGKILFEDIKIKPSCSFAYTFKVTLLQKSSSGVLQEVETLSFEKDLSDIGRSVISIEMGSTSTDSSNIQIEIIPTIVE